MGCSKDEATGLKSEEGTEVQLVGYVANYEEDDGTNRANGAKRANGTNGTYGANRITRGWIPPTGFSGFEDSEQPISVFFTWGTEAGDERYFFTSSGKWRVSGDEVTAGTYYLYGYVPHNWSITASVGLLTGDGKTYGDGAVLTIQNVPTVSATDVCVIIGARNGYGNGYTESGDYSITGLTPGGFEYVASGKSNNYVFLLFDHLFSALRIRMRVNGDYHALRTIKLKELHLTTSEGDVVTKKKTDITVTLNKTDDGTSPIAKDGDGNDLITFTQIAASGDCDGTVVKSTDGIGLGTDYYTLNSYFMPAGVNKLTLTSTYDVYDKKGNLVRQGCKAQNSIDIRELFSGQTKALRGRRYTINLTINPTYLYMMSDPDLNNPTVTVE